MNSTHTAARAEEGERPSKPLSYDFVYEPEVSTHTPAQVHLGRDSLCLMLKAQAGIQGLLAVMVGAEVAQEGGEGISGPTRGQLLMGLEALAGFSYAELARAVKQAEADLPRH